MKVIMIVYHKNVFTIYEESWIKDFVFSVLYQTYVEFQIYEMNYGGGKERLFTNSTFFSEPLPTFVDAMNYLIEKSLEDGADVIANNNVDDINSIDRLEVQMKYINEGYDLVSSNFSLMKDDILFHEHHFENKNIKQELEQDHNIICHPIIIANRAYWKANKYVPEEIPLEDLLLWKRSIDDFKFIIAPENLLTQRIHNNSVCKSLNR